MAAPRSGLAALIRRDRVVVLAGVAAVTVLAWIYLLHAASTMNASMAAHGGPDMTMPLLQSWGPVELRLLVPMWTVMMVAMMVPSVSPLILMFATMNRQTPRRAAAGSTALLLLGYLFAWTAFSVVAALAQWSLHRAALLSPMMVSTSAVLGGLLLIAAGVWQLSPFKRACLAHCRSPLGFLMQEWRPGARGSLVMGWKHGGYCVGCCWLLMSLLLVAGVMNLLWVAAIAIFVLVEKASPRGDVVRRITGAALTLWGVLVMFAA